MRICGQNESIDHKETLVRKSAAPESVDERIRAPRKKQCFTLEMEIQNNQYKTFASESDGHEPLMGNHEKDHELDMDADEVPVIESTAEKSSGQRSDRKLRLRAVDKKNCKASKPKCSSKKQVMRGSREVENNKSAGKRKRSGSKKKAHMCKVCSKSFDSAKSLKQHTCICGNEESLACQFCHESFTQAKLCKKHEALHKTGNSFKCLSCGSVFSSSKKLQQHCHKHINEESKQFVCLICGKAHRNKQGLDSHLKQCAKNGGTKPSDGEGNHLTDLHEPVAEVKPAKHTKEEKKRSKLKHKTSKKLLSSEGGETEKKEKETPSLEDRTCKICGKVFARAGNVSLHMRLHTGERPFSCSTCGKNFHRADHLKNHVLVHVRKKQYKCDSCDETFKRKDYLKYHKINNHGEKIYLNEMRSYSRLVDENEPKNKTDLCEICGISFANQRNLRNHLRIHSNAGKYSCQHCGKTFNQSSNLNIHLRKHTGETPYKCLHCEMSFTTSAKLKTHARKHTGDLSFTCEICGRLFGEIHLLRMHMKIHNDKKPYKCDHCGKAFTHGSTLQAHIRTHTGAKPYKCDQCNDSFAQISSLKYHKRTHSGEKPYSCHVCGNSYTRLATLNVHLTRHTGQKRISCPRCEFKCDFPKHLRKHVAMVHSDIQGGIDLLLKQSRSRASDALYAESIINSVPSQKQTDLMNPVTCGELPVQTDQTQTQENLASIKTENEAPLDFSSLLMANRFSQNVSMYRTDDMHESDLASQNYEGTVSSRPPSGSNSKQFVASVASDISKKSSSNIVNSESIIDPSLSFDNIPKYSNSSAPVTSTDHSTSFPKSSSDLYLLQNDLLGITSVTSDITSVTSDINHFEDSLQLAVSKSQQLTECTVATLSTNLQTKVSNSSQTVAANISSVATSQISENSTQPSFTTISPELVGLAKSNVDKSQQTKCVLLTSSGIVTDSYQGLRAANASEDLHGNSVEEVSDHLPKAEKSIKDTVNAKRTDNTIGFRQKDQAFSDEETNEMNDMEEEDVPNIDFDISKERKSKNFSETSSRSTRKLRSNKRKSGSRKLKIVKSAAKHMASVKGRKEKSKQTPKLKQQQKSEDTSHKSPVEENLKQKKRKGSVKCDVCGQKFSRAGNLTTHMRLHSGERPYSCTVCDKRYSRSDRLRAHMKLHNCDNVLPCNHCGEVFNTIDELYSHTEEVHEGRNPFSCNICDYSTMHLSELKVHVKGHEDKDPFHCDICNISFNKAKELKKHMESHDGQSPFICHTCDKSFRESSCLKLHMMVKHTGEKHFKCGVCAQTYVTAAKLQRHMRTHSGARPFACEFCGKLFIDTVQLKMHVRIHTNERPFKCKHCEQSFTHRSTLRAHIRTHTGTKPYACDICGAAFAQVSSLAYHQRRHDGLKPYTCHICGNSYTRSTTLNQHMSRHTGQKRVACPHCEYKCNTQKHLKAHLAKVHNSADASVVQATDIQNVQEIQNPQKSATEEVQIVENDLLQHQILPEQQQHPHQEPQQQQLPQEQPQPPQEQLQQQQQLLQLQPQELPAQQQIVFLPQFQHQIPQGFTVTLPLTEQHIDQDQLLKLQQQQQQQQQQQLFIQQQQNKLHPLHQIQPVQLHIQQPMLQQQQQQQQQADMYPAAPGVLRSLMAANPAEFVQREFVQRNIIFTPTSSLNHTF